MFTYPFRNRNKGKGFGVNANILRRAKGILTFVHKRAKKCDKCREHMASPRNVRSLRNDQLTR